MPCYLTKGIFQLAEQFLQEVIPLYRLSLTIVSDREPQFTSTVCGQVCSCLGIYRKMSTAFHFLTDDQSQRTNVSLEHYLCVFVNH
jgi:hypothetical protein